MCQARDPVQWGGVRATVGLQAGADVLGTITTIAKANPPQVLVSRHHITQESTTLKQSCEMKGSVVLAGAPRRLRWTWVQTLA